MVSVQDQTYTIRIELYTRGDSPEELTDRSKEFREPIHTAWDRIQSESDNTQTPTDQLP